ncbi:MULTISPECIES: GspE/PulE family protein [Kosmotoga]|uniref:Type II secretion system protein E n=1 Tax=Kosmotoga olearia (strain ATCC BAA-1733 / DSM 21960 / TBF 19.5.1) TaxID=521045 RepID=C5CDJ6_KOSOT|nr:MULTISPECIES: GspE/PulE family protein [Kosmotoga]ACR79080.1 type II secretion system protein E [Kosmotoga olearia TBF 19.5.1]MDI3524427.1 type pilus assembly protein PilB [Kosmotoga sp.]MDK2953190.1 type pilus assembly protein PilB [Kosmotoga sp.]OAA23783.1 general secretion pathway protein GspE [Kosmotoga sp. DU53]
MRVYKRLGELLTERGLITPEVLQQAVTIQKKVGKPLGEILVGMGLLSWEDIYTALSKQYNLELVEELPNMVPPELLKLVPRSVAERLKVVPIEFSPETNTLKVVTPDVLKVPQIERELSFLTGNKIKVALTPPPNFEALYRASYEEASSSEIIEHTFDLEPSEEVVEEEEVTSEETPVGKFINALLENAIRSDASDIHLEPFEKVAVGRFRIDGILRKILTYPRRAHNSVVSRIKVMCGLDISEKRLPQDGKFFIRRGGEQYDFRVSTMPTIFGEKVVMRVLRVSNAKKKLEELGLSDYNLKRFRKLLEAPHGIILVSGPTGSGKSTTLVAVLNEVTSEKVNVVTAEDPVEYTIEGITQCQVNAEIGLTFARYLRAFLRQDPDVIMVGEIRDRETAQLAIEASLTGHLVFSTIHTNSAPGAVARLVNMGVDPFLLSASLIGVIGQRLVRRLCSNCKVKIPIREEILEIASKIFPNKNEFYEFVPGSGCNECRGIGYKGRTGIHEVLIVNNELRDLMVRGASEHELSEAAKAAGMRTLYEDGIEKVLQGITSVEEVNRVATEL